MSHNGISESRARAGEMLCTAMGAEIACALSDPTVVEVMVNPDGRLWLDRLGQGRLDTGVRIDATAAERIIRLVASSVRKEAHAENPIISAELPARAGGAAGERFEGVLPPVAASPCFSIRKPAS